MALATGPASGSSTSFNGPALSPTGSFAFNTSLAPFIGTGALSFFLTMLNLDTVAAAGLQSGGIPANAGTSMSTSVLGSVSVSYEYSPVPLPATLPLLLAALGVAGFRLRRAAT